MLHSEFLGITNGALTGAKIKAASQIKAKQLFRPPAPGSKLRPATKQQELAPGASTRS